MTELCPECGEYPADYLHTCLFLSDLFDDDETMCVCCDECTFNCMIEV